MEDLFGLLIVIVTFIFWVAQNIIQSKRRAKHEFEEAWEQFEEVEEGTEELEWVDEEEPRPAPRPAPALPPPTAKPGAPTWKQLQQQLEEILKQPSAPKAEPRREPASPQRGFEPSPEPRKAVAPTATVSEAPPRQRPQPAWEGVESRPRTVAVAALSRQPARTRDILSYSTALEAEKPKVKPRFPYLHPNPVYNAVIMAEIIRPYSRGPAARSRPLFGPH